MTEDIRAILFDFDGVLAATIEDHHDSWNQAFAPYGVSITWDEFAQLEGQSLFWICRELCVHHGIDENESETIAVRKNDIYMRTKTPRMYPEVSESLSFLAPRCRLGLVTGAHKDRFEISTDVRFRSLFSTIITADDVTNRKPDPEPYLKAASMLGAQSQEVIVIENAPFGIESARAAGMTCIALRTTLTDKYLKNATWIVDDLKQAVRLVSELAKW